MIEALRDWLGREQTGRLTLAELAMATAGNRLQQLLDRALAQAPLGRQQLAALDDGSLAIAVSEPAIAVQLSVVDGRLAINFAAADRARATLSGRATALAALLTRSEQHSFAGSGVTASGDLAWLGQFNAALAKLDIDWAGVLAEPFGDLAGPLLANAVSSGWQHGRRTVRRSADLAVEVVQQEWQLLPSRQRLQRFNSDLTELRRGVDRLQARLDFTIRQRERQQSEQQP